MNIGVYNALTKQTTIYNSNTSVTYPTASIVKVSVLANLLRMSQSDDASLSPAERTLAESMIVDSDNDATTTLLNTYQDGYTGPDNLFSALHMTQSKMNPDAWGMTTFSYSRCTSAFVYKSLKLCHQAYNPPLFNSTSNCVTSLSDCLISRC